MGELPTQLECSEFIELNLGQMQIVDALMPTDMYLWLYRKYENDEDFSTRDEPYDYLSSLDVCLIYAATQDAKGVSKLTEEINLLKQFYMNGYNPYDKSYTMKQYASGWCICHLVNELNDAESNVAPYVARMAMSVPEKIKRWERPVTEEPF